MSFKPLNLFDSLESNGTFLKYRFHSWMNLLILRPIKNSNLKEIIVRKLAGDNPKFKFSF